jgi:UDP-N-acetylglucosamine acyltransferase
MAVVHVAHDCALGDGVIGANNVVMGGHVTIGDHAVIGGAAALHQFVRIGEQCIIGGLCGVRHDVIPFAAMVEGRSGLGGLNIIGLKRRGFSRPQIHALRAAYRDLFYGGGTVAEAIERVAQRFADDANVMRIVEFVRTAGKRRITVPHDAEHGGSLEDAA